LGAGGSGVVHPAWIFWLIRGNGHTILFDSGFHRSRFLHKYTIIDYLQPDKALLASGVKPDEVTDVIISHAHFDHMGGIDLFPNAKLWIQRDEFLYYTVDAWQPGGNHLGVDPDDVAELVKLNTEGRVHLINGDNVELLPGIRAFTGARHTYASQFIRVDGNPPFVLASDSCFFAANLAEKIPSPTFSKVDRETNLATQTRMISLAGSIDRVICGHDGAGFRGSEPEERVATVR
jgi:glyoxylase-like metal-dependent hydrolase (beta-lactamase superfamily II)